MNNLLKSYVYNCLNTYGNTYILPETYKQLGKQQILEDLRQHGFDCTIKLRILEPEFPSTKPSPTKKKLLNLKLNPKDDDIIYVIAVKRKENK